MSGGKIFKIVVIVVNYLKKIKIMVNNDYDFGDLDLSILLF